MKFEELEQQVRVLVSQNKLQETIDLLNSFFTEDDDLDEIIIQSSHYHAALDKQISGTADAPEVELAMNRLKSNILQLLRSKKEYFKYKQQTFGKSIEEAEASPEEITVFFSVGSPHNDIQQTYIDKLVEYFKSNGIKLETLKA
ncbi:MAG: hypothetical protein R3B47_07855 [Bacteroidia bacterium]